MLNTQISRRIQTYCGNQKSAFCVTSSQNVADACYSNSTFINTSFTSIIPSPSYIFYPRILSLSQSLLMPIWGSPGLPWTAFTVRSSRPHQFCRTGSSWIFTYSRPHVTSSPGAPWLQSVSLRTPTWFYQFLPLFYISSQIVLHCLSSSRSWLSPVWSLQCQAGSPLKSGHY
jgi:hypothetical protein